MAKDFFVGWQEKMSASQYKFLKRIILSLALTTVILAGLFAYFQKKMTDHSFQLGKLTKVSGTYYSKPFPILIAESASLPENISNEILLVGFGKFGAESTMADIQKTEGDLTGKKVTLEGTLIYGDGKTLMELSKGEDSFISSEKETRKALPTEKVLGSIEVEGEILDPKCYFGVMKPGEGKIHKSCAIRCISGGIPPVFRKKSDQKNTDYEYFLLLDEEGNRVNQLLLQQVGVTITLKGKLQRFLDWNILYVPRTQFYENIIR